MCNANRARAAALGLAAQCKNLHVFLDGFSILLDKPSKLEEARVHSCITQLTIRHMLLTRQDVSRLCFKELTHLHTISFKDPVGGNRLLNDGVTEKLSGIISAGGLPCLTAMAGKYKSLCERALLVGCRITKLSVEATGGLEGLDNLWPKLQHLRIKHNRNGRLPNCRRKVVAHRSLTHVAAPACCLTYGDALVGGEEVRQTQSHTWEVLELTGSRVSLTELAQLPLQGVKLLEVPAEITFLYTADLAATISAAAQNIQRCNSVKVMLCYPGILEGGIYTDKLAVELHFIPELLAVLFEKDPSMSEVLLLDMVLSSLHVGQNVVQPLIPLEPAHLAAIHSTPRNMHSLICYQWSAHGSCCWREVFASPPSHITKLYLHSCFITENEWGDLIQGPPPMGLRRLILKGRSTAQWIPWEGDDLEDMQKQVWIKWPDVQLLLD